MWRRKRWSSQGGLRMRNGTWGNAYLAAYYKIIKKIKQIKDKLKLSENVVVLSFFRIFLRVKCC